MLRYAQKKLPFLAANIAVMYVLHGNSRQFWPKIPYLSLRNESVTEHSRLLFNTLLVVTLGQLATGRLTQPRLSSRLIVMGVMPMLLPLLIAFGQRGLGLYGHKAEVYYISLVPFLTVSSAVLEDSLMLLAEPPDTNEA